MGPQAEKLKELLGVKRDVDLTGTLKKNPELAPGLNEYLAWRDQSLINKSREEKVKSFGHSVKNIAKTFKKKK